MSALKKLSISWFGFWVAFALIGIYFLYPLRQSLRFGIDLVGGTYIVLEVQTEKAIEANLVYLMESIPMQLEASGNALPVGKQVTDKKLMLTFDSLDAAVNAANSIKEEKLPIEVKSNGTQVAIQFTKREHDRIVQDALARNIEVLRNRLDKTSVAEITIAAQGDRRIVIELPDVDDPQQARAMIGKSAKLEFKLVEKAAPTKEDILYELDGELPGDMEIVPDKNSRMFYLVPRFADVTGDLLKNAKPDIKRDTMQRVVAFEFTPQGGEKFYKLTSQNINRNLAVVLDGVVITAPGIQSAIRSSGVITGDFTASAAKELAMLLKSGSFVAPVTFEEERQIGPSLGQASIRQGLLSCLVGLGLLFIFSVFYYKLSGLFAFIALVYNLLLVLMGLSWLNATLTLPGIAGMILTIGMAIDASILIYERIKEELTAGMTIKKAVRAGFSNAMVVILDANITTFIVGLVLYKFGTGPIQGFAVTMMFGIIATLVTGLFFLRSLFMAFLDTFNVQKLSI